MTQGIKEGKKGKVERKRGEGRESSYREGKRKGNNGRREEKLLNQYPLFCAHET